MFLVNESRYYAPPGTCTSLESVRLPPLSLPDRLESPVTDCTGKRLNVLPDPHTQAHFSRFSLIKDIKLQKACFAKQQTLPTYNSPAPHLSPNNHPRTTQNYDCCLSTNLTAEVFGRIVPHSLRLPKPEQRKGGI